MNNGGKINLTLKKTFLKKNHSITERSPSPHYINNTSFNNYMNNNSISNFYRKYKESRNIHFPYLDNSHNYYLSSVDNYSNSMKAEKGGDNRHSINSTRQNESVLLIQRMKNYQRKKNETNIISDYYSKHYIEMMKKNKIDENTNGINLSISNYETQSPINNTVDEHEDTLIQKLKYIVENYEKRKANSTRKSFENFKKEKSSSNISKSILVNKINRSPLKRIQIDDYYQTNMYNVNNTINKRNGNISRNYYKTLNNFRTKNNENILIEEYNNSLNELKNNTARINKNKKFNYINRSKIKLMNIYNQENGKKNLSESKSKNKNRIKYEKYLFEKIKIFINKVEYRFVKTLKNNYLYFIEQLKLFSQCNKKEIDYISLMNRFQKSRNIKNTFLSSNTTYSINNNSVEYIENKNKIHKNFSNISKNTNVMHYIQKNTSFNTVNTDNSCYNTKRKSFEIFPYLPTNKNLPINEKRMALRNINTEKIFASNKKDILIKDNNQNMTNMNSTNKKLNVKSSNFKYIYSFDRISNINNTINKSNNTRNDDNKPKNKPIIYTKPQAKTNFKKKFTSKEKESSNNNNNDYESILCDKALSKRSVHFYKELNNCYNTISDGPLLIKKNTDNKNSNKSYTNSKKDSNNSYKKIPKSNNNKYKKSSGKPLTKNYYKKHITKNICTSDKRVWINIKYITSENSMQIFYKMKIKRIVQNPNSGVSNIFLNNKFKFLKCAKTDSIKIIRTPVFSRHIMKNNKKFDVIVEENNEDNNNTTLKMIDIFQSFENQYVYFYKKYFFGLLKKYIHFLSEKKIFDKIKNNFKIIDYKNICNHTANEIIKNSDIGKDNTINSDIDNNNKRKKINLWRSSLFSEINSLKLNEEDKQSSKINSSKSEMFDRNDFYKTINDKDKMMVSKNNKPNKTILIRVNLAKNINASEKTRKKNKIMKSLINKFNYYNNCLRIKKKYFTNWRIKKDEYKESANMSNGNINNLTGKETNNDSKDNTKINEEIKEKKEKRVGKNENNNTNMNQNYNIIKLMKKINEPLNGKRNIAFKEGNKMNHSEKNELKEKIEYLRRYLIYYYVFKDKNNNIIIEDD